MKLILTLLLLILPSLAHAQGFGTLYADKAYQIKVNTSAFGNLLPVSATTVQAALSYINYFGAGGSSGSGNVGISTVNRFAGYVGVNTLGGFQTVEVLGNVGIGTTGPSSKLSVSSTSNVTAADINSSPSVTGIDSFTKLMLHVDNNVTDSELTPKTVTNNGATFTNTAGQAQFGFSANFTAASSNNFTIPYSADFAFGTGDFTFDFWIRKKSVGDTQYIWDRSTTNAFGEFELWLDSSNKLNIRTYDNSLTVVGDFISTSAFITDTTTLHWVVLQRSGSSCIMALDGVSVPVTQNTAWGNLTDDGTATVHIGYLAQGANTNYLNSYLDEIRVSKGVARSFSSIPTMAYGVPQSQPQLTFSSSNSKLWAIGNDGNDFNKLKVGTTAVDTNTRLTIDSVGNIGIGTTNPPNLLYNAGTIGTQGLQLYGNGAAAGSVLTSNSLGVGTWMAPSATFGVVNSGVSSFYGRYPSTGVTIDDSAVTMDDGTNVGIGTVTPTAKLNISTSAAQDLFRVDDNGIPDTTPFIIDSTGNVGIGSATPSAALAISSTANQSLFRIDDNGTGDTSPFIVDANGNVGIGTANTETDKLLVMGGNVGIGTWVPFQLLDVKGKAIISDNVGIGSLSPGARLDVQGALRVFTATSPVTKKAGANTACNTTCAGSMCIFGQDTLGLADVACNDATADICFCLGP